MTQVTPAQFFAALHADKRDIMPSIVSGWSNQTGYTFDWRTTDVRRDLFGRTQSGNGIGENKTFKLTKV